MESKAKVILISLCIDSILSGRGSTDADSDGHAFLMLNLLHYYPPSVHLYIAPQWELFCPFQYP